MLVAERDELVLVVCKNIEMLYMRAVGGLEYKLCEVGCAVQRLKRKIDLIQAKKNRQEKVVPADIEKALDAELAAYQEELAKRMADMNAALRRGGGMPMSDEDAREIKALYHTVVKSLHPDLHPSQGEAKTHLFRNAVDAYKNGDLDGLRAIGAMTAGPAPAGAPPTAARCIEEEERLSRLVQVFKERTAEAKAKFPYTMRAFVNSPEKIAERRTELEESIRRSNITLAAYAAKIEEMLGR
jgi:hypothetical protein